MEKFKQIVQKILIIFVSREFAFLFVISGVIAQVIHTYYLAYNISSLGGSIKIIQAVMLSAFISVSLLYFVSVSDNGTSKQSQNTRLAVNLFMVIEILINLYYYSRHLLLLPYDNGKGVISINQWFDFVFGVLLAVMIPVTIKLYASHIRAKEWINDMNSDEKEINEVITNIKKELDIKINNIDTLIKNSFERNSTLFINQYKNKIKNIDNQNNQNNQK